jgi:hypothetical protein
MPVHDQHVESDPFCAPVARCSNPSLLSMTCSEELSLKPSRNVGVNGAPNGLSVPRWSLSKTHLKGSRPWASLSRNYRLTRAPSSTWRRRDASEALYEGLGRRNQGDLGGGSICGFIRVGKRPHDCSADNDHWETGRSASVVDPRARRPAIARAADFRRGDRWFVSVALIAFGGWIVSRMAANALKSRCSSSDRQRAALSRSVSWN